MDLSEIHPLPTQLTKIKVKSIYACTHPYGTCAISLSMVKVVRTIPNNPTHLMMLQECVTCTNPTYVGVTRAKYGVYVVVVVVVSRPAHIRLEKMGATVK